MMTFYEFELMEICYINIMVPKIILQLFCGSQLRFGIIRNLIVCLK